MYTKVVLRWLFSIVAPDSAVICWLHLVPLWTVFCRSSHLVYFIAAFPTDLIFYCLLSTEYEISKLSRETWSMRCTDWGTFSSFFLSAPSVIKTSAVFLKWNLLRLILCYAFVSATAKKISAREGGGVHFFCMWRFCKSILRWVWSQKVWNHVRFSFVFIVAFWWCKCIFFLYSGCFKTSQKLEQWWFSFLVHRHDSGGGERLFIRITCF